MVRTSFENYPNCHSGSRLDEFVARLLDFKKNGTYVDIGSAHSMQHNNSHYLAVQLDWRGVCVELDSSFRDTYKDRKDVKTIFGDATKVDYKQAFDDYNLPQSIDYLSLDVDVLSTQVMKMLPVSYRFKVIGIEHDHYLHGDLYRAPQREYLLDLGYVLACNDVFVRSPAFDRCSFEDWYLDPYHFGSDIISKVASNECHPEDIINKLL